MSYVFDTLSSVWSKHIRPLVVNAGKEPLAFEFEALIEELHDANHRLNDAVNRDGAASKAARNLEQQAKAMEAVADGKPPACCGGAMSATDPHRWKCGICDKIIML